MCHFISAVLPASADIAALTAVAERHGRNLRPQNNPSVRKKLKTGENYFLTTVGHCDCGTPLGAHAGSAADEAHVQIRKLRAKGWSETKIARLREQRGEHQAQKAAIARTASETGIAQWQSFLSEALMRSDTPYLCLLIHMYSGALDGDIELSDRQTVKLQDADTAFLDAMSEDVLYEFRT
jgi:hypothetical protein